MAGAKVAEVVLGGETYKIPRMNIGQLERVTDLVAENKPNRLMFGILRIALERVEPKIDPGALEIDTDELADAVQKIAVLSGLKLAVGDKPGDGANPTPGQGGA